MLIGKYNFKQTCSACPEQYDVFDEDGNQVAYVRLRWGCLSARSPDVGGADIYYDYVGDASSSTGCFESDEQRRTYLTRVVHRLDMFRSDIRCPVCENKCKLDYRDLVELDRTGKIIWDCCECENEFEVEFDDYLDRSKLVVNRRSC